LKLVAVWQVELDVRRVGFENNRVASFGTGCLSGIARVEMPLSGFPAHKFLFGCYFHSLGRGFSGFQFRHNIF